ncbi:MAG: hypothetical protein Q7R87_00920 [Nanoarchaeota archaeon]|nr:hypothetical protein [Nanoarchaeota archaeon]
MNKRGQLLPIFLILLLVLIPFASANLQDNLQEKADSIQDKADKLEDLGNTFSDKDSRTEYLSKKWGEFINKTPIGKAITSTTATIKTADPLIELIFGAKFNFNLSFLLIFSIWLIIFSGIRKVLIPKVILKIKRFYNQFYHLIVAFILTAFLGGIKLIPNIIAQPISFTINKIPSLFTQIFLLLLISFILIWFAIRIPSPNKVLKESKEKRDKERRLESVEESVEKAKVELKKEGKKVEEEINKIEKKTGLKDDKELSQEEQALREQRRESGLKLAEELGKTLEESDEEIEKKLKETELKKPSKLKKPKKLL